MPERTALITALIIGRPLCFDCIASRSGLTIAQVEDYLVRIRASVNIQEHHDRCRTCGTTDKVMSLDTVAA